METAKMTAGARYGTCDGLLFIPEEPLHSNYAEISDEDGETRIVALETDLQGKRTDPWGDCKPARLRSAKIGIKGRLFREFDRDGEPLDDDEGELTVVPARDVKGTWPDYLVLHGEKVRRAYEERVGEELRKTLATRLKDCVADDLAIDDEKISVSVLTYNRPEAEFSVTVKFTRSEVERYVDA